MPIYKNPAWYGRNRVLKEGRTSLLRKTFPIPFDKGKGIGSFLSEHSRQVPGQLSLETHFHQLLHLAELIE